MWCWIAWWSSFLEASRKFPLLTRNPWLSASHSWLLCSTRLPNLSPRSSLQRVSLWPDFTVHFSASKIIFLFFCEGAKWESVWTAIINLCQWCSEEAHFLVLSHLPGLQTPLPHPQAQSAMALSTSLHRGSHGMISAMFVASCRDRECLSWRSAQWSF